MRQYTLVLIVWCTYPVGIGAAGFFIERGEIFEKKSHESPKPTAVRQKIALQRQLPPDPQALLKGLVEEIPLDERVESFFNTLIVRYKSGVQPIIDKKSATIPIEVMMGPQRLNARFVQMQDSKGNVGTSFILNLPIPWKLSDMVPKNTIFDGVVITQPILILSDVAYTDSQLKHAIEPGLQVVGMSDAHVLKTSSIIGALLTSLFNKIQVTASIAQKLEDSVFIFKADAQDAVRERFALYDFISPAEFLLPDGVNKEFEQIALEQPNITFIIDQDSQDLMVHGTANFYGRRAAATFQLYEDSQEKKIARSCTIELPPDWHFKDYFPELLPGLDITFNKGVFVLTDHAYKDKKRKLTVEKGLNFLAEIDFKQLRVPPFFARIGNFFGKALSVLHVQGVIKKDIEQSSLVAVVPEEDMKSVPIRLSNLVPFGSLLMPQKLAAIFRASTLEFPRIALTINPKKQEIFLYSSITSYGRTLPVRLLMFSKDQGDTQTSVVVQLPKDWQLMQEIPEFKGKFTSNPRSPSFVISTTDYKDKDLGIAINKGLNFLGAIDTNELESNPVVKVLQKMHDLVPDLVVHITIPPSIANSNIKFVLTRLEDKIILLRDIVDLETPTMPAKIRSVLRELRLIAPQLSFTVDPLALPVAVREFQIEAGTGYKGRTVRSRLLVRRQNPSLSEGNPNPYLPNISFELELPFDWTFKDDFDDAEYMDEFSLDNARIIVSNFNYDHPDFDEVKILRGLNFVAGVKLDGPLTTVATFVDKVLIPMAKTKSSTESTGYFVISGVLGPSLIESGLSVHIPLRIGLDFDLLYISKLWPFRMPFVKKITTDTFSAMIKGQKNMMRVGPAISLETGLRIFVRSQEAPLVFRAGTTLQSTESTIYGSMNTLYKPAFGVSWLALSDFGAEITFDYSLLQAALVTTGLPMPSGIGFRGSMELSDERLHKVAIALASKISLSTTTPPILVFHGKANRVTLANLVWLLGQIGNNPIQIKDLPQINFERVELRVVPEDVAIAQKLYSAGLYASAWINILGLQGGIELGVSRWGISGKGMLPKIDTPWLKLSAAAKRNIEEISAEDHAIGIADFIQSESGVVQQPPLHDGPSFQLDITWLLQRAFLTGKVEIPLLRLSQEIEADLSLSGIKCRFKEQWLGLYSTEFELLITKENAYVKGRMQQDALDAMGQALQQAAQTLIYHAHKDIKQAEEKVEKAKNDLKIVQQTLEEKKKQCTQKSSSTHKNNVVKDVKTFFEEELIKPTEEFFGKSGRAKACSDVLLLGSEIAIKRAAVAVAEEALVIALQGARATALATSALSIALSKGVNLQEASFEVNAHDMKQGRSLSMNLKGIFFGKTMSLAVPFDVEHPEDNIHTLFNSIMHNF